MAVGGWERTPKWQRHRRSEHRTPNSEGREKEKGTGSEAVGTAATLLRNGLRNGSIVGYESPDSHPDRGTIDAGTFEGSRAAAKPLMVMEVPLDLRSLESEQTQKYKWVSVTQSGTNTEWTDYASLVISSKLRNKKLEFHDTITMGAFYHGMIFDRGLVFPGGKLFTPERIVIDITFGPQTVRQLDYKNGKAKGWTPNAECGGARARLAGRHALTIRAEGI